MFPLELDDWEHREEGVKLRVAVTGFGVKLRVVGGKRELIIDR